MSESVCEVPGFCKASLEDIDLIQAFPSTGKAKITLSQRWANRF